MPRAISRPGVALVDPSGDMVVLIPSSRRQGDGPLHRKRAGFTIFELLVLLVALSAVASFGIPAYFGRPTVTLDNAVRLLAKDVHEIQNRAALYEEQLWIRFESDGTGYRMTDRMEEPLISPYGDAAFARNYPVDAVFRGVKIESVTPKEPGAVVFDARGRPLGEVTVVLAYRGARRTLSVHKRTGLISIDGIGEDAVDLESR